MISATHFLLGRSAAKVWCNRFGAIGWVCRLSVYPETAADSCERVAHLLHQACNAMTAHAHALILQRIMDARATIALFEAGIDRANLLQKLPIVAGSPTFTVSTQMATHWRVYSSNMVSIFSVRPLSVRSKIKSHAHTWLRWVARVGRPVECPCRGMRFGLGRTFSPSFRRIRWICLRHTVQPSRANSARIRR